MPRSIDSVAGGRTGRSAGRVLLGMPQGARGGSGRGGRGRRKVVVIVIENIGVEEMVRLGRSMARPQLPPQTHILGILHGVGRNGRPTVDETLDLDRGASEQTAHLLLPFAFGIGTIFKLSGNSVGVGFVKGR